MSEIVVRDIQWGTKEYEDELALRNEILRVPLGSTCTSRISPRRTPTGMWEPLTEAACGDAAVHRPGEGVTQMRQVAVDESCRRQGVGRKMVAYGEELMKGKGFSTIVLDARKVALDFYLALGYQVTSEELILSGIPHFKMKKEL